MARQSCADGRVDRRTHGRLRARVPKETVLPVYSRLWGGFGGLRSKRETAKPLRAGRNLYLSWAARIECPILPRRHWLVSPCFAPTTNR